MKFEKVARKFNLRFKFDKLRKYFSYEKAIKVLDVGAGNHSASVFKLYYPNSHYTAIDRSLDYEQNDSDFKCMDEFIKIDLNVEDIEDKLRDNKYDLIIMSHIIEHLKNAEYVIEKLVKHLKKNGIIYIEWPGEKALYLPSWRFPTLNFYDDATHVKVYPLYEICNVLKEKGLFWCEGGVRRHKKEILCTPFMAIYSFIIRGKISGSVFWDLCGFANYVIYKKD